MDEFVEELVRMDTEYLNGYIKALELLRGKYKGNEEMTKTINNLIDVRRTGLKETVVGYASFGLSHLCRVGSCEVISPEEAEKALAILKGSTQ